MENLAGLASKDMHLSLSDQLISFFLLDTWAVANPASAGTPAFVAASSSNLGVLGGRTTESHCVRL